MNATEGQPVIRRVIGAAAIDTLGVGMFEPLTFLFFLLTTHMTTLRVGVGITIGTVLAFPLGLVGAAIVDRFGARELVLLSNVTGAVGFALYLLVRSLGTLVLAVFIVMSAERLYSGAWPAFIALLGHRKQLDRLYAKIGTWKTASLGIGYLIGGGVLALGHSTLFPRLVVGIDILTYLAAALLTATVRLEDSRRRPQHEISTSMPRWRADILAACRTVTSDQAFRMLCLGQVLFTFAWVMPTIVLPTYLVERLNLPRWLPSVALAFNVCLITALQRSATSFVSSFRRSKTLVAAAAAMLLSIVCVALVNNTPGWAIAMTLLAMAMFSLGEVLSGPTANALVVALAPEGHEGRYLSIFQLMWIVSTALGPLLVGALFQVSVLYLWGVLSAAIALGGAAFLFAGFATRSNADVVTS